MLKYVYPVYECGGIKRNYFRDDFVRTKRLVFGLYSTQTIED